VPKIVLALFFIIVSQNDTPPILPLPLL